MKHSVESSPAKWTDDFKKLAVRDQMREAKDVVLWRKLGETKSSSNYKSPIEN